VLYYQNNFLKFIHAFWSWIVLLPKLGKVFGDSVLKSD